jgi:hypothetical protein
MVSHDGLTLVANMLIEMLMEIDVKRDEPMIYTICDDTLGGVHSIDACKFAKEFIQRRSGRGNGEQAKSRQPEKAGKFDSANKFVVVGKKGKKSS